MSLRNAAALLVLNTRLTATCKISTSVISCAGAKWRVSKGLGKYGNEYGPLHDTPDWSFADGRPAPLTFRGKEKLEARKAQAKQAMDLMREMREAKQMLAQKKSDLQEEKRIAMSQQLKPVQKQ